MKWIKEQLASWRPREWVRDVETRFSKNKHSSDEIILIKRFYFCPRTCTFTPDAQTALLLSLFLGFFWMPGLCDPRQEHHLTIQNNLAINKITLLSSARLRHKMTFYPRSYGTWPNWDTAATWDSANRHLVGEINNHSYFISPLKGVKWACLSLFAVLFLFTQRRSNEGGSGRYPRVKTLARTKWILSGKLILSWTFTTKN